MFSVFRRYDLELFFLFFLKRLHVGFEICHESTIRAQEVGPVGSVNEISYTLVVPHVTTRSNEQSLAGCNRVEADTALRSVHTGCIRVSTLVDPGALEQALVSCGVEIVETLLPATVTLDANLDTSEDDLLATLEVYAKLNNVAIINRVRPTFDAGT